MIDGKIEQLVRRLQSAAGDNLRSVILYGSAATEESHSAHSDLNLLCVLRQADAAHLEALHDPVEWWVRRGRPSPLIFTMEELRRSADIFTIELLDMKSRHRILFGENVLSDFSVPTRNHALQVERELRGNWLRLRQAIVSAPRKPRIHLDIMAASFPSFAALFRHALIALGEEPAATRREAIDRIAKFAAADPVAFHKILELREGKPGELGAGIEATLNQYFAFVEAVTDQFDRRMETAG